MRDGNPALIYREIAKKMVAKAKENLVATLTQGGTPDLYWKLETAIVEAMRYADQMGADRMRVHFETIVEDFEQENGTSRN